MKIMKGNIADQIFITVIFLAFCITSILAYFIWSEMSTPFEETLKQATGGTLTSGASLAISQTTATLLMFDQLFIVMIVGSWLAIIISSFWMDTHPVFFIISLLTYIFSFVTYAVLGNVFAEFVQNSTIQVAASNFPLMYSFWSNSTTIAMIFSATIIVVVYSKMRGKSGGSGYAS